MKDEKYKDQTHLQESIYSSELSGFEVFEAGNQINDQRSCDYKKVSAYDGSSKPDGNRRNTFTREGKYNKTGGCEQFVGCRVKKLAKPGLLPVVTRQITVYEIRDAGDEKYHKRDSKSALFD
jgi:hypothetical protein